jgi:intracellular sulfur oxidation DsrE/DsrF family protein
VTLKGTKMSKYQVIFHLDEEEPKKIDFVLHNMLNLLNDLGDGNVDVELLVNGPAVKAFKKDHEAHADLIEKLLGRGVDFALCHNALNLFELAPAEMLDNTRVVPSGVGELVRKQSEGWAYIRP